MLTLNILDMEVDGALDMAKKTEGCILLTKKPFKRGFLVYIEIIIGFSRPKAVVGKFFQLGTERLEPVIL